MDGHYLVVTLPEGKEDVRREFLPLEKVDEDEADAVERWILQHPDMITRKRNREKTADAIRASILYTRIARPSSYYQAIEEREGRKPWLPKRRKRRVAA